MTVWVPPVDEYAGFSTSNINRAIAAGLTFRPLADTAIATVEYWNTLDEERRGKPKAGCPAELEETVLKAWHAKE
jgi:2'-hydroxyisoflavone reductase